MSRYGNAPVYYVQIAPEGVARDARIEVTDEILSLRFEDVESAADKLSLTIDNHDLRYFDDPLFKKGNVIEVAWGYSGNMCPAREVVIQKVTGFTVLTVDALSKSILMNKVHRQKTFENTSRSEIAHAIAKEWGYDDDHRFIEETKTLPFVTQPNLTDAQFLKQMALKEGFEWYIDFDGFHFHKRILGQRPLKTFVWFFGPDCDILDIAIENDVISRPGQVTVKAIDPVTKQEIGVDAGKDAAKGQDVLANVLEVVDPKTGETHMEKNTASATTIATAASSAEEAKAKANAAYNKAQQTAIEIKMKVVGDPSIVAKATYRIEGIGRRLSGNYYCKKVETDIVEGGSYTCAMTLVNSASRAAMRTDVKPPTSDGKLNDQASGNGDLTPVEVVDPKTGETKTEYRDTAGRAVPKK